VSEDIGQLYNWLRISPDDPVALNDALRQIDDSLRILLEELFLSRANPPYVPSQQYRINGVNDDIDPGSVPEDLWDVGGPLTWPTAAGAASIVSDSAADAGAGIGAQTVRMFGVDANFDYQVVDITMGGISPVVTTETWLFVHLVCVVTVGANETNVGNIQTTVGGNVINQITAGKGQSASSHFLVPNPIDPLQAPYGESFQIQAGRNSGFVTGELVVANPGEGLRSAAGWVISPEGPFEITLLPLAPLQPGTRLWLRVNETSGNNMRVRCGYSVAYYPALPSDNNQIATDLREIF
jgi:hypothetical protein